MPRFRYWGILITTSAALLLQAAMVYAATDETALAGAGRILDGIEAEQADTAALAAEAKLFKSIGMGLSLSLAQCELLDDCTEIVNHGELQTLLDTLDNRINGLIQRQEQEGQDFTELLALYVDQRENYLQYQDKLEEIAGPPEEPQAEAPVESFTEGSATPGDQLDLSVFEDANEDIEDIGDEGSLPADEFNPEQEIQ